MEWQWRKEAESDPQEHRRPGCFCAQAIAHTHTHTPFYPLPGSSLCPPSSMERLTEGRNKKQAYTNLDSSKHCEEPETQACFVKGWKRHQNGHPSECITRSPGRRDISCGTQQGEQLVHAGHREKPTGRGMGCHRPEVQGRSPMAIERSLQTLERPFPSSLHSDHLKPYYFL